MSPRERLMRWEDPFASAAAAQGMSGLEFLTAMRDGSIAAPPFVLLLNARLVEVAEGRVVFEGQPGEEHYNPIGVVHGGYAMGLLDCALGCAVYTRLSAALGYGTTDVHARLLRPITLDTGLVRCEAHVVSITRTLGTAEGRLTDANGKILATGTTACAIFPRPA